MLSESKSSTLLSLPGRTTRGERAKNQGLVELVGGLDEVKKETMARSKGNLLFLAYLQRGFKYSRGSNTEHSKTEHFEGPFSNG